MTAGDHGDRPLGPQPNSGSSDKGTLGHITDFFDSTTKILLAVGGLIAAGGALWAALTHLVPSGQSHSGSPGHTVQYVVQPESCGALTYGVDGTIGPIKCPDGRPDLAADRYYRTLHLKVLTLGAQATPTDVYVAICQDLLAERTTLPIEEDSTQLAMAEQDWHFGINPVQNIRDLTPSSCRKTVARSGK